MTFLLMCEKKYDCVRGVSSAGVVVSCYPATPHSLWWWGGHKDLVLGLLFP